MTTDVYSDILNSGEFDFNFLQVQNYFSATLSSFLRSRGLHREIFPTL